MAILYLRYCFIVVAASAFFYDMEQNNSASEIFWIFVISLCAIVPVFGLRKLFKNAQPGHFNTSEL